MEVLGQSLLRLGQSAVIALALHSTGCAATSPEACAGLPGTPQEIAASPRSDGNLELLALRFSDGVTADQSIYQRLERDIGAIRAQVPAVRNVQYSSAFHADTLYIEFDESRHAQIRGGSYHAWDCLNEHYGATSSLSGNTGVSVTFTGRFNLPKLAALYAKLPGVKRAQPVRMIGGAPTILVTRKGETWHYVFNDASGDCAMGCTESDAYYFQVEGEQPPKFIDRWQSSDRSKQPPEWVDIYLTAAKRAGRE